MTRPQRIDGVDLSHYQSGIKIDWQAAKAAGVWFVYHKATQGTAWTDPEYGNRRAEAKKHNVLFGAYHFADPKVGNAADEANHFLTTANIHPGDLVPMLDLESTGGLNEDQLTVWVHTWFETVFRATGVRRGWLYTPFPINVKPKGVRLWVARYNDDNRAPNVPHGFRTWGLWQFSDGQNGTPKAVPGIGHVDIDTKAPWIRKKWMVLPKAPAVTPGHPTTAPISRFRRSALRRFLAQGKGGVGLCLMRVRESYGIPAKYPDAISAWNGSQHKHPETDFRNIPPGYPVFWAGGSAGHGHVAEKKDTGYRVESTDILRTGYVDVVDGRLVHTRWGLTLLGYTTDLNGVPIP